MSAADTISLWLDQLLQGDADAAQRLWERYYERLIQFARRRLNAGHRRVADEEDIVLSAFHSFCQGAAAGRFPQLRDRDDLWKLLVTITARKAVAQVRRATRAKRGGGEVRGESAFIGAERTDGQGGLDQWMDLQPTPEFAAMVAEQCEILLDNLVDETLRRIACLKLEGYTNVEIADQLDCAVSTVERKLARIRSRWKPAS